MIKGLGVVVDFFNIITLLVLIIIFPVALTGVKLLIFMFFSFVYEKVLWLVYSIFHIILLMSVALLIVVKQSMEASKMLLYFVLPVLIVFAIIEYLFFYRKYFDFESNKKFIAAMSVSYIANFGVINVGFSLLLTILVLTFGVA